MAAKKSAAGIVPPYGVAIREALQRGDPAEMARVAKQARDYVAHAEEVKAELVKLDQRGAQAAVVPYGEAIQQAIKSGDRAQMERVAAAAEAHLQRTADIREALELLKAEIGRG